MKLTLRVTRLIAAYFHLGKKYSVREINDHNAYSGYRHVWKSVQKKCVRYIPREIVRKIISIYNPDDVAMRKRHRFIRQQYSSPGPNFTWHVDGYDNLKRFGFLIHGGIDGFSRRLMWLRLVGSNNNPLHIADLFLDCVFLNRCCPAVVRSDYGTENTLLSKMQMMLRDEGNDGLAGGRSHQFGKSAFNQRIESFWLQLSRTFTLYWSDQLQVHRIHFNKMNFTVELSSQTLSDRGLVDYSDCLQSPSCKIFVNGGMVIPFAVKGIYERYLARPPMTSSLFLGDMLQIAAKTVTLKVQ
ncbi:uncharacterized protein [Oscarella lobularis]|uniref:uncharacterized protein n=1 Tax=Oscarella lobularis TaxID=121494 RepID=UPI003313CBC2